MRKRIIETEQTPAPPQQEWLDLARLAAVEISSEDETHPIEAAVVPGMEGGWRAARPGRQTIRLCFDPPQALRRIMLEFQETQQSRTQEYRLRISSDGGDTYREIIRQQWNFSPQGSTRETEQHALDAPGVTLLELTIIPDIGGGNAIASLAALRLA